jgi:hypothetical protein
MNDFAVNKNFLSPRLCSPKHKLLAEEKFTMLWIVKTCDYECSPTLMRAENSWKLGKSIMKVFPRVRSWLVTYIVMKIRLRLTPKVFSALLGKNVNKPRSEFTSLKQNFSVRKDWNRTDEWSLELDFLFREKRGETRPSAPARWEKTSRTQLMLVMKWSLSRSYMLSWRRWDVEILGSFYIQCHLPLDTRTTATWGI